MRSHFWKTVFLLFLIGATDILCKRGGGGGFGRGGGFGSRGSSAARASSSKGGGGGWFGGGSKTGGGTHHTGGAVPQPNYGAGRTGSSGTGGGFFGGSSKSAGGYHNSGYMSSGMGSRSRSDTFKNMIVGAAAGYLAYQGGKAIIRSMTSPMMWNGRNYYWGSQYYPGGGYSSGRTMCRMPVEPNDPKFGNIYTPEGSRPKEIVWSCNMNEMCCGYECCPAGGYGGGGYGGYGYGRNYGTGIGLGTILLLLLICCCGAIIVKKLYDKKRENDMNQANKGYQPGNVSYTANAQPSEAPPPYPNTAAGDGYPPANGWRYPPA